MVELDVHIFTFKFRKLQARSDRNQCRQMVSPSCCSEWPAKCKRLHLSKKTTRMMTLNDDDGGGGGDDNDDYQYYY
jgi:hypothetical protein